MNAADADSVPRQMRGAYEAVVALTDAFCAAHLDAEYAALARKMAATLARARPSPLARGGAKSWAAGIVYHLGQINWMFDAGSPGWIPAKRLVELLGVSGTTALRRAREIRERLRTDDPYDVRWFLPSRPEAWMLERDGIAFDARLLAREAQEEMFRLGLIPFVPDAPAVPPAPHPN